MKCFIAKIAKERETAMRRSVWRGLFAFATAASIGLLTMATTAADAAAPAALAVAAHRDAPACKTSGLDIWAATNYGSEYAGGYYDSIYLTNMSGHRCTLLGHAGVSTVGLSGDEIGSPAGWVGPAPTLVTLAQDATAAILVQVGDPANYGGTCFQPGTGPGTGHPAQVPLAAGLRVYPPNQLTSKVAPLPVPACYHHGPVWMHVGPVHGPVILPYEG
jgi:Protein of unknown function (DUF4232)